MNKIHTSTFRTTLTLRINGESVAIGASAEDTGKAHKRGSKISFQ